MKLSKCFFSLLIFICSFAFAGTMKDLQGNSYPTVKIGDQVWMAKNMNADVPESVCYQNKRENCKTYGRLYTWGAAQNVCPGGWHLPKSEDFHNLVYAKARSRAKGIEALRSVSWNGGSDEFGFGMLPGGQLNGKFLELGEGAFFWTSSGDYSEGVSAGFDARDYGTFSSASILMHSVRCVQDTKDTSDSHIYPVEKSSEKMKDSKGNTYPTTKIGEQVWMAKNMADPLPNSACYKDSKDSCKKYGRLYDWESAMEVCPTGWHLPSQFEVKALLSFVGNNDVSRAYNLRSEKWGGSDAVGFGALPSGRALKNLNDPYDQGGVSGFFWTSSHDAIYATELIMHGLRSKHTELKIQYKETKHSVRCVQNYKGWDDSRKISGSMTDKFGNTYPVVKIGNQEWMATNMTANLEGAVCKGSTKDKCRNGRLYEYGVAQQVCPTGWRLPNTNELKTLLDYSKSERYRMFGDGISDGLIKSGFIGYQDKNDDFSGDESVAYWGSDPAGGISYSVVGLFVVGDFGKLDTLSNSGTASVRCIRDDKASSSLETAEDALNYPRVRIGNKVWMGKNMNVHTSRSHCYADDAKLCKVYGRLYPMDEALKVCPAGWHLPSKEDYEEALNTVGKVASLLNNKMYATYDKTQFGATLSGRRANRTNYYDIKNEGYYWTSSVEGTEATHLKVTRTWADLESEPLNNDQLKSVRCVLDEGESVDIEEKPPFVGDGTMEDADGNVYPTVIIGDQEWMAKNLNYNSERSVCANGSSNDCDDDGRLYYGSLAQDACPSGWRLPSGSDYRALIRNVGGESAFNSLVVPEWSRGTNEYGFSAAPITLCGNNSSRQSCALYWTSTRRDAYFEVLNIKNGNVSLTSGTKQAAIRCVKNEVVNVAAPTAAPTAAKRNRDSGKKRKETKSKEEAPSDVKKSGALIGVHGGLFLVTPMADYYKRLTSMAEFDGGLRVSVGGRFRFIFGFDVGMSNASYQEDYDYDIDENGEFVYFPTSFFHLKIPMDFRFFIMRDFIYAGAGVQFKYYPQLMTSPGFERKNGFFMVSGNAGVQLMDHLDLGLRIGYSGEMYIENDGESFIADEVLHTGLDLYWWF